MAEKKYLDYDGLQTLVQDIKDYCDEIGHFVFKGTSAGVAALPSLASAKVGDVYTITEDDVTTADFMEGAGKVINANDEVVVVKDGSTKKWAVLGPIFDISDRLQFGMAMPSTDLTNGRIFLYMGDTTYTFAVFTPTYDTVTPVGDEDPSALHWYEESGGVYSLSVDTEVDSGKTYYSCATNPSTVPLYETNTGSGTESSDTYVDPSKTYYTRAEEYVKGVIYKYSTTDSAWIAQSSGDSMVPITTAEINALFD